MIQWFRGELEASYVGTPNAQPYLRRSGAVTHFKLHVYRAALIDLERVEPPPADASEAPASFRQERVDDALIAGARGPGTTYQGPIFALSVSEPSFTPLETNDGKAYGRLTGRALLYCDLPLEPAQPAVELVEVEQDAPAESEPPAPLPAELRSSAGPTGEPSEATARASAPSASEAKSVAAPASLPRARSTRTDSAAPLSALAALVALGLWVSCSAAPALLWCLFITPTLIARKLLHGVLNDSPYIRGFGAVLVIAQLVCVSSLVSEWWSLPCKELHALPLIVIVAVIFPAGVLPSVLPFLFNAGGLAVVLALWCGGSDACGPKRAPAPFAPATVEHPGVPRTNEDGTWPRRPPGR